MFFELRRVSRHLGRAEREATYIKEAIQRTAYNIYKPLFYGDHKTQEEGVRRDRAMIIL